MCILTKKEKPYTPVMAFIVGWIPINFYSKTSKSSYSRPHPGRGLKAGLSMVIYSLQPQHKAKPHESNQQYLQDEMKKAKEVGKSSGIQQMIQILIILKSNKTRINIGTLVISNTITINLFHSLKKKKTRNRHLSTLYSCQAHTSLYFY